MAKWMDDDTAQQLLEQGASNENMGNARLFSAFAPPAVQAAVVQEASRQTERQIQLLRRRFDQEEFKKVKALKFDKTQGRRKEALAMMKDALIVHHGPVSELQGVQNRIEPAVDPNAVSDPILPPAGAEQKAGSKPPPMLQPPPQPGMQAAGSLPPQGSIQTKEAPHYLVNGVKIPVSSRAGIKHQSDAVSKYYEVFSETALEDLSTASEFGHNERVGEYAMNIIQLVTSMAEENTSGINDPQYREEMMRKREEQDVNMDTAKLEQQSAARRGMTEIGGADARLNIARNDPERYAGALNEGDLAALASGQPLQPRVRARISEGVRLVDESMIERARLDKLQGKTKVPAHIFAQPESLTTWLEGSNNKVYMNKYVDEEAVKVSELAQVLRSDTRQEESVAMFERAAIPEGDIETWLENGKTTEEMDDVIKSKALTRKELQHAKDLATVQTVAFDLEPAQSDEFEPMIDAELVKYKRWLREKKVDPAEIEMLMADRHFSFIHSITGRDPRRPNVDYKRTKAVEDAIEAVEKKHAKPAGPKPKSNIADEPEHRSVRDVIKDVAEATVVPAVKVVGEAARLVTDPGYLIDKADNFFGLLDPKPGTMAEKIEKQEKVLSKAYDNARGKPFTRQDPVLQAKVEEERQKLEQMKASQKLINLQNKVKDDIKDGDVKSAADVRKRYFWFSKEEKEAVIANLVKLGKLKE